MTEMIPFENRVLPIVPRSWYRAKQGNALLWHRRWLVWMLPARDGDLRPDAV